MKVIGLSALLISDTTRSATGTDMVIILEIAPLAASISRGARTVARSRALCNSLGAS